MTDEGVPENLRFGSLEERSVCGRFLYYELYLWKLNNAPKGIDRFCDPKIEESLRGKLIKWIRDVNDRTSCQSLQILFSFSIPSPSAIEKIVSLHMPIISAGAGTGYWEMLLQQKGVDVAAFDKNDIYPPQMRYFPIMKGDPSVLSKYADRALMLGWPDAEGTVLLSFHCHKINNSRVFEIKSTEGSTFSLECLKHYKGNTIIHIGELFGETFSPNPWGQSTSQGSQLQLGESFRCISRVELPNWPGHLDSLTIWTRVLDTIECDGMPMVNILPIKPRYYGCKVGM